jgi:hypothetical protein
MSYQLGTPRLPVSHRVMFGSIGGHLEQGDAWNGLTQRFPSRMSPLMRLGRSSYTSERRPRQVAYGWRLLICAPRAVPDSRG